MIAVGVGVGGCDAVVLVARVTVVVDIFAVVLWFDLPTGSNCLL